MSQDSSGPVITAVVSFIRVVLALIIAAAVVPPVAAGVSVTTLLNAPLPGGELPEEHSKIVAEPSVVLDAAGKQIGLFRGFDRTVRIEPDEVPKVMKDAVVAIEDRRFWEHNGVDIEGISRAARTNAETGGVVQGGSTITQQYIKNAYLSGERTIERKVREALLATELEKQMSKEEILFGYLESSYFGSGAYGVGAAAELYFGKSIADVDSSEAALLAGLVQAPTRLSPRKNLEAAEDRRLLVLEAMQDEGYLSDGEFEAQAARVLWVGDPAQAPEEQVTVVVPKPTKGASEHPFFVDWVERSLIEHFGEERVYQGGLTIETTIRSDLQVAAEASVAERLQNTEYPVDMSMVSINPTNGHVLAMVGGRDHSFSQVNLATGGSTGLQPGSSFKPIVLAKALSLGIDPETIYDAPAQWRVPGCSGSKCFLKNYDGGGRGSITLRDATRASVNTVFTQLLVDVGINETVTMARQLGLERLNPEAPYGPSLALGAAETSPLEMASAYGTFANRGIRIAPTGINRVLDGDGNVLIDNRSRPGDRVLEEAVADNITDVLKGVVESGTGKAAAIDRPVAGKTGTAQAYRAAWFVGYTPSVSTAVWMGHANKLETLRNVNGVGRVTGGSHPARAFSSFMSSAVEGTEVQDFPEPAELRVPDVVEVDGDSEGSEEVVTKLRNRRRQTLIGNQDTVSELITNCNGQSCERNQVARPKVPRPAVPVVKQPSRPVSPPKRAPSSQSSSSRSSSSRSSSSRSSTTPSASKTTNAESTRKQNSDTKPEGEN